MAAVIQGFALGLRKPNCRLLAFRKRHYVGLKGFGTSSSEIDILETLRRACDHKACQNKCNY